MGAGILMSISKRLFFLQKDLYLGVQGSLRLHGFRVGLCKAGRIPFFGIHECCIFAVCYSGGRSSVGIHGTGRELPFILISPHSLGQMGQLPSLSF
jgi:hypothetical protein